MPSVYTIEGASPRRKKSRRKGARTAQQRKMAAAAKACKGRPGREFRACVKDKLRR